MERNAAAVKRRYRMYRFARWGIPTLLLIALAIGAFLLNGFHLQVTPLGETAIELAYGADYREMGARATLAGKYFLRDGIPVDAKITGSGSVNTKTAGEYILEYRAEFLCFAGQGERSVTILESHDPVITLESIPDHYTLPGKGYEEEGYSAFDEEDGDLTEQVIREEKDGKVCYTVTDSHGNTVTAQREIYYFDPEPPIIELLGDVEMTVFLESAYREPGFCATDNADGDISHRVQVTGSVNTKEIGSYTITYQVADTFGNEASAVRTIHVAERYVPDTVMPEGKTLYLTFDDGPGPYTEELLDVLKQYDVKATFFVMNTEYLHLLPRMVEEGHAIGIHSITHNYREIYKSQKAYFRDLEGMQQIIYERTGVRTYLMRFPGGSSNTVSRFNKKIMTKLTKAVTEAGFCYFDWNVDSDDAGNAASADEVFCNVTEGALKQDVSVVLQHDIKDFSVDAVERIILWGLENGYSFRILQEDSPGMHHEVNN